MKKKYVIFDMDGVLFDSERLIQRCWRQVGEQQGLADIGETFLQCVGTTRRHTSASRLDRLHWRRPRMRLVSWM